MQTLAIIQLYLEERWIEPPHIPRLPLSLLYHQTMSILYSHTELSPPQLAERVLTLSPFQQVSTDHFRQLLQHLLEIEHIERSERGRLIIGVGAEKMINNYRFFAVFEASEDYRVRDKSREIGTIPDAPAVDSTLVLAGFMWRVLAVDTERRIVEVARAKRRGDMTWSSRPPDIHTRVLQMMREILLSRRDFVYLSERARRRLDIARQAAQRVELEKSSILPLADNRFLLFPWCGTRQFHTLELLLRQWGYGLPGTHAPYWIALQAPCASASELRDQLARCARMPRRRPPSPSSCPITNVKGTTNSVPICRYRFCEKPTASIISISPGQSNALSAFEWKRAQGKFRSGDQHWTCNSLPNPDSRYRD